MFPSFFKIDTSISTATRQQIVEDALKEFVYRRDRENCRTFMQGVIDKLKAKQVLRKEISSSADLVACGLNKSTIYLYGARYFSDNLGKDGRAVAKVDEDTKIYLGEWFYSGTLYRTIGGDQVNTLIHEMGHFGLITANGKSLRDDQLSGYLGYNSYDDWGRLVRTNCGPR